MKASSAFAFPFSMTIKSNIFTINALPLFHSVLALLWVSSILFNAATLHLPFAIKSLGSVVIQRHLLLLVLEWVEWLRLPIHVPVL